MTREWASGEVGVGRERRWDDGKVRRSVRPGGKRRKGRRVAYPSSRRTGEDVRVAVLLVHHALKLGDGVDGHLAKVAIDNVQVGNESAHALKIQPL